MSSPLDNPNLADELLSAYLDGELSAEERAEVEARLAADPGAREMLAGLESVSAELKRLPRVAPEPRLTGEVLRRVGEQLAAAGKDSENDSAPGNGATLRLPLGRSARGWWWAGLAVAASLAMVAFLPQAPQQGGGDIAKLDAAASDIAAAEEADGQREENPVADRSLAMDRAAENRAPAEMIALADEPAELAPPAPAVMARREAAPEMPEAAPLSPAPMSPTPLAMSQPRMEPETAAADTAELAMTEVPVEAPLLVVRVKLSPRAFQQNFVDTVFTNQGIAVEPTAGAPAAESLRLRRSQVFDNARNNLQAEVPAAPANSAVVAAAGNDKAQVLVVEAPAPQFAAALNDLRLDVFNCSSIAVTPPDGEDSGEGGEATKTVEAKEAASLADANAGSAEPPAQQWLGYNRFTPVGERSAAKTRPQAISQLQTRQQAYGGNAYRLQQGELRQLAQESQAGGEATRWAMPQRGVDLRSRNSRIADNRIPAPTDPSGYVQALVIVEPDETAGVDVLEASPATEAPATEAVEP